MIEILLLTVLVSIWIGIVVVFLFQCGCCGMMKKGCICSCKTLLAIMQIVVSLVVVTYLFLRSVSMGMRTYEFILEGAVGT